MADDEEPSIEQTTPRPAAGTFVMQKIQNHGASNPIVARLCMQTMELVKMIKIPEDEQKRILMIYLDLHQKLLQCYEIQQRLQAADEATLSETEKHLTAGHRTVPFLVGLENESEAFLYAAKNYLRELVRVVNAIYGTGFPINSSIFWDDKEAGNSDLVVWARKLFGDSSPHTRMLEEEDHWISELIRKRNAVEHPGGKSGTLLFENYTVRDGRLYGPNWRREGKSSCPASGVLQDIEVYLENLLTLAEDLLVEGVALNPVSELLVVQYIPPDQRNPAAPVRLRIGFNPQLVPPLPSKSG
ncbi:MAG: hypothetical protein KJ947_20275 [Alphaproteobacteria bacterium]|mgnify:CR=1 FL=1|jgi:hypothetical protein|nr:hypothetical protein [Alphaproteobacteria bacterium]MBU1551891.1 hypothetical protein [Alphaproteobacteria bacterium]MBU2335319.1 hypothetical protein [Alphaproteobacteria bacterium]MBU2391349.1 hypothetical protein [Alphaproteobacteria bacterium]|tara:strand:- start:90 stop:989 length:900 start_codon:yes stop_codon:yes gene_type:complete